jgi:transglutaminase-like putative cysteine protease
MAYRLSWLAGIFAITLALARVSRLVRSSVEGLPWQAVVIAAAALGAALTWAALAFGIRARWVALVNVVAVGLMVFRVAVPDTTWFVFPTNVSLGMLSEELAWARDAIQGGVAPVDPLPGLIAILSVVFWALGSTLVWGLIGGRPYVAVLAPLVVYLEFAVMDRQQSAGWATAFLLIIGLALLSIALDQRRAGTGLLTSQRTRRTLARSAPAVGAMVVVAIVIASQAAGSAIIDLVPRGGHLDWRSVSGLSGQYFGSVSYNPFVGIQQRLISPANTPVFTAEVDGPVDPRSLYWRLVTLDSFNGFQWHIDARSRIASPDDLDSFEPPELAFEGPTARVRARVTIEALRMDWLPAPYSAVSFASADTSTERNLRVKTNDASLRYEPLSFRGMTYTIVSEVPQPDLSILSLGADGQPSPMFDDAALLAPAAPPVARALRDAAHYTRLPAEFDPGISELARQAVAGAETDFERAVALETFFRTAGDFRYSTEVEPGHGARDLSDWLLDPDSPNHRVGYCEQFATAMAVMARSVGLPSRVVLGFTPGIVIDGIVVVRDRNAHAWVEVWMPTQGWVAFDPTPRGDGINPATADRLPVDMAAWFARQPTASDPLLPGTDPNLPPFEEPEAPPFIPGPGLGTDGGWGVSVSPRALSTMLVVIIAAASLPMLKWRRRRARMIRLSEGDVSAAWQEIVDRLSDLGDPPALAATPSEIAVVTGPTLVPLAAIYAEAVYGPEPVPSPERVALAARSLAATEHQLVGRYSIGRRLAARYSLASVLPTWWRRRIRRR